MDTASTTIKYKLSCTVCRSRKIKCDKVHPCSHCVRSGSECVFPERKRMQRPRKTKNSELLNRISRLESIVGNVDLSNLKEGDAAEVQKLSELRTQVEGKGQPSTTPAISQESRRSSKGEPSISVQPEGIHPSRYMSSDFWSSLSGEVEGLKQALAQSTDSDSEEESNASTPDFTVHKKQTFTTQGLLASYPSPESAILSHPSNHHIQFLITTFFERVDPIIKILHRPTTLKMVKAGTSKLSTAQEALQFSMYFAAVTSLSSSDCLSHLGQDQMTLLRALQLDVERSLAAADYLNNNDLECLQAFTIYVACLRVHNDTRASWVLTAMLLRLAQAHNLLRDGDGSRYTPFIADMRRRLWWQVVVLDIRASEDRGTEAMVPSDGYNTRLPLNINDDDYGPDSTGPLVERTGPTDVTFSLCTAQSSIIFIWVVHAQARLPTLTSQISEEELISKAQALETEFVKNWDPAHYGSTLAAGLVRLINLKLWLILQYPIHQPVLGAAAQPRRFPKVTREAVLQTTVNIMEIYELKNNNRVYAERFSWWGTTYVQWHPLAVALAELCTQTRGALVDKAWQAVEVVYPKWANTVADSKRGALWRPIRKLYKKAKEARARALRDEWEEAESAAKRELLASQGSMKMDAERNMRKSVSAPIQAALMSDAPPLTDPTALENTQLGTDVPMASSSSDMVSSDVMGWTGWSDINFDMPLEDPLEQINWGVWGEFLDDTYAESASRTGSSEDNFP